MKLLRTFGACVLAAAAACSAPSQTQPGAPHGQVRADEPGPGAGNAGSNTAAGTAPGITATGQPTLAARLPREAGPLGPAHTDLAPGAQVDGAHLADVETCADCHMDVAAQWATSAHAFASFSNPVYRVSIQGFREQVGGRASHFCGGCHDVALLVDNAMLDARPEPVAGTIQDAFEPGDKRAHAGITCRICHGITEVRPDGNGSYTLRPEPIPLPEPGDQVSLERHRQAVQRSPLGPDLCVSCHRSFLGAETGNIHQLVGMDDATGWQGSAYTGSGTGRVDDPVQRADCMDCHMMREPAPLGDAAAKDGTVASHRFLGGHTWLAAMRGDSDQLARTQAFLQNVVSIDIAAAVELSGDQAGNQTQYLASQGTDNLASVLASQNQPAHALPRTLPADGAPLGRSLALDVVVRNLGVGHRFPGGVRDALDTWIEVTVRDARGALVASSGTAHERNPGDDEAHVLRSLVVDENGRVRLAREVHSFRAPIADHTVGPRDVGVTRYVLHVPEGGVAEPLEVHAQLRHRSRNLTLQAAACAESRTRRGKAFDKGAAEVRGRKLDPCVAQPVTTMAERRIWIGKGWQARAQAAAAAGTAERPAWRRLYEHGLGWLHGVQERLDEARPSLLAALAMVEGGDPKHRAMIMTALGTLAGRQGRTEEAMAWLDQAEAIVPGHAAVTTSRGAALTQVWRWREAIAPLTAAAERAPLNTRAQALLAIALGSAGEHEKALAAAQRGLALNPRDEALLRVQAVSLAALGAPDAAQALDAYARFRAPDQTAELRFACALQDHACARDRELVHVHVLTPAARQPAPARPPARQPQ